MGFTKATSDYLDAGGIIKWITTPKTSAFTAVSGEGYLVDTTSAAITVTLPTSPSEGDEIIITDYASNAGTNNITLDPGTLNLKGATDDLVLSTNNQSTHLLYSGATKGWLVTSDAGGVASSAAPALTVDYLVVAGGGGGGASGNERSGGGGGSGGFLTSYGNTAPSGGSVGSSLNLSVSTIYNVTIGAGGPSDNNGSNSEFNTLTSVGGGAGGGGSDAGSDGGSGGGGGGHTSIYSGGVALNTGLQGNNGGNSAYGGTSTSRVAGGGGGAGAAGVTATASIGGNGGDGISLAITGSSAVYAGGGGGGNHTGTAGTGGTGGGGNGAGSNGNGGDATANTGGGGGGSCATSGNSSIGGTGGSGIVVLRYPSLFTISIGSGLTGGTVTDGSDKITTFTAGTGTISFA